MKIRDIGWVGVSAVHPRMGTELFYVSYPWDPAKAARGHYSRKVVKAARECGKINAKDTWPLGVRETKIKIRFIPKR